MCEPDNIRSVVKDEFLNKLGQEIIYAKDCQVLSISILQKTNRRISITTLKRLFGIIHSRYKPSKYTLDSLAIYLDYRDWEDLNKTYLKRAARFTEPDYWTLLRNRIKQVTDRSLTSMKASIGDQYSDFQVRKFATEKFEAFLESPQIATAFIAPGGYGKTSIAIQLTELFFTGPDARYPGDIVCLVDGSILVNLINLNLEVVRLKNIVDFQQRKSFSNYFRKHPEEVKGRFVLIIDGLCQTYHQKDKLNLLVENLMDIVSAYEDVSWFKLLVTCIPDDWKKISYRVMKHPHLESKWFGVHFGGSAEDSINVPLLSRSEIMYFLGKRHSAKMVERFKFYYPDVTQVFNIPYMLHLFSNNQNLKGIHSDLELLDYFVSNKVLIEPYLEEKSDIINAFFRLSAFARQNSLVKKADLALTPDDDIAFKELIASNVFYEYTIRGSYLSVHTFVKFTNNILLEFFLANKWMEEHAFDLQLIRKVCTFYENNPQLKANILKFLIKIAFKENNRDVLSGIFTIFEGAVPSSDPPGLSQLHQEIISTIGIELRKNKHARAYLIPLYAKSESGQLFYFERFFDMDSLLLHSGDGIDYYLAHKHTDEALIFGHFLKFMQYFIGGDQDMCKKEYELFQNLILADHIEPALAGYYYGAQLIYQSVFAGIPDPKLLSDIYRKSDRFYRDGMQSNPGIPLFEYIVIYALNYGNRFAEVIELADRIMKKYSLDASFGDWRSQLFLLIYARALLNSGDARTATAVYNKVKLRNIPVNYTYYVHLRSSFIRVEFLVFEKRMEEAKSLIEELKTKAQMIRQSYFYEKALMWDQLISKH